MVMRWTRASRYSGVISSADSRRSPRSILASISCCSLMTGLLPSVYRGRSAFLDDAHGLAFRARQCARWHQRDLGSQADGLGQLLADAAAQVGQRRVRGVEAAATRQER